MPAVAGEADAVYLANGPGGNTHGAYDSPAKKEKKPPTEKAGEELYAFAGILTDINSILKAKGEQLGSAIGSLVDKFAPGVGSLISAGWSLFSTLFGGKKKVAIDGANSTPIPTFPAFLSLQYAANPIQRLYRGEEMLTGAALNVNVQFRGDAKQVLTGWVGNGLAYQNQVGGVAY